MSKKEYFPVLTGFRALAAYLVFFSHNPLPPNVFGKFVYNVCNQFFIGVTFFFLLSGFLITIRYSESVKLHKEWFYKYLINRVARIYPMYFIVTTITFCSFFYYPELITNETKNNFLLVYIANITFIKSFFSTLILTGVAQGWTLTLEECFYFTAPFIFILKSKYKLSYQVLMLYIIGIILWLICRNVSFFGLFSSLKFVFAHTFFGRCLDFFIGIKLAQLYKKRQPEIKGKYLTSLGAVSVFLSILLLIFTQNGYDYTIYSPWGVVVNNSIVPFATALFIWGLLTEKTILSRILSSNLFSILGKSSYTFYLIHMGIFNKLLLDNLTHNYFYNFPILILISIVFFYFIEDPLNKIIRNSRLLKCNKVAMQ